MHDIWNPWHGCKKRSEGCLNCYMYFLDSVRGRDGAEIYRTKAGFDYPLSKDRNGDYKIKSGELIRVCMTSDFFLEEADEWRNDAWEIMRSRPDVKFFLLTKRPERIKDCLPSDWGDGWENIILNVSAENQRRADERVPELLSLPFKHKGVMCAPLIGRISLKEYLKTGMIEQVLCDGENYSGARVCDYEWVKTLSGECAESGITFVFISTGRRFRKDGRVYSIESSALQREQAFRSGLTFKGKEVKFELTDRFGIKLNEADLYKPFFRLKCERCPMKIACNGCSNCGKCEE